MRTRAPSSMSSLGGSNSFSAILMVLCTWSRREVDPRDTKEQTAGPIRLREMIQG